MYSALTHQRNSIRSYGGGGRLPFSWASFWVKAVAMLVLLNSPPFLSLSACSTAIQTDVFMWSGNSWCRNEKQNKYAAAIKPAIYINDWANGNKSLINDQNNIVIYQTSIFEVFFFIIFDCFFYSSEFADIALFPVIPWNKNCPVLPRWQPSHHKSTRLF